jgi:methylenetetrahydrofolate--tRNA-(uracil-5-)-methyltransferase
MQTRVHIVGSGLAGSEAAYFLAENGIQVILHEMRPLIMTPAHETGLCAELVCSNSLKSKAPNSATGMLKAELTKAGSIIMRAANVCAVPAGEALAVDRTLFSQYITDALTNHPNIKRVTEEVTAPFENEITLLASGPLTSDKLVAWLVKTTGSQGLYFYDAIAPVVDASTIDKEKSFLANRYDKGCEEAYINCPLNEQEYNAFIDALLEAERMAPHPFEKEKFFQGCQPIEAIAMTGRQSLRFGPMKPVGLKDPITGNTPFAVVQLRTENRAKTAFNIVGFQTKLKYGDQQRVFKMIPALREAEFLRLGSIHRNTYVCAPETLRPDFSMKGHPLVYLAGQLTGVEGYLESAASGLLAAIFIKQRAQGSPHKAPPANTAMGALHKHVAASEAKNYQPANMHFGLFDPCFFSGLSGLKKDEQRQAMAQQAITQFTLWLATE